MRYTLRETEGLTATMLRDTIYDPVVRRARLLGGGFCAAQRALRRAGASYGLIALVASVNKRTAQYRMIESIYERPWHAALTAYAADVLAATLPGRSA